MSATFICLACGREDEVSARSGEQNYCGFRACQNAGKAAWKRHRLAVDSDYRANQRRCYQDWCRENPGYWTDYRRDHPEQAERNRQMQRVRNDRRPRKRGAKPDPKVNAKATPDPEVIAKVDASWIARLKSLENCDCWLIPAEKVIAKVDALKVKFLVIPGTCK